MSNVVTTSVTADASWDLAKLQKNSKAFNNYLRKAVAKIAGTKKAYNRNLVKPIVVNTEDDTRFTITISATKKPAEDLHIVYKVIGPEDTDVVSIDADYATKDDVVADLDEVDTFFESIKVA